MAMPTWAAAACLALACCCPATAAAWKPSAFLISFWVDPVVPPAEFSKYYAPIAEANFSHILGGFGATTPAAVASQLAAAGELGLSVISSSCESASGPGPNGSCVGAFQSSPALAGYQLYDEPSAPDFASLATWLASVSARSPSSLRFVNLLPNYASAGQLGTPTYGQYLSDFVSIVHPDILCFDHYPTFGPGSATSSGNLSMAGYIRNLAAVRAASISAAIPFFNFFGAMPFNNRSDFSEGQMRWQVFTSLAHGAKGLLYFCYWKPDGDSFLWGGALMLPRAPLGGGAVEYGPGPHYWQAQRVNSKLKTLGSFLLAANSSAVQQGNGTGASTLPAVDFQYISRFGGSGAGPAWSLMLGFFTLPTGASLHSAGALIVNADPDMPCLATMELTVESAWEVDPNSGALLPVLDDAPGLPGLQLQLEPGDARLLCF